MSQELLWKLVPVEPTVDMVEAGRECAGAGVYRRMLAAAPVPPAGGDWVTHRDYRAHVTRLQAGIYARDKVIEAWAKEAQNLETQRDALKAEVERLTESRKTVRMKLDAQSELAKAQEKFALGCTLSGIALGFIIAIVWGHFQ